MNAIPRNSDGSYNIISGTVTNRVDGNRSSKGRTAKRLAIIIALAFLAFIAFGMTLNALSGSLVK